MTKTDISNREDIKLLVDDFYENIKMHKDIGYIFTDIAKVNWGQHLPRMYDFWETTLFGKAIFKGNPMEKHIQIDKLLKLAPIHFSTWLNLWYDTIDKNFKGQLADAAKQKATNIANLMELKIQQNNKLSINIKNKTK